MLGVVKAKLGPYKASHSKETHKMFLLLVTEEFDEFDKRWKEVSELVSSSKS